MSAEQPRILISGAGPTGLLTALELCRHGVPPSCIRVIDMKGPELDTNVAKAIAIHSRSVEVLDDAGVLERFRERGMDADGAVFFDKTGRQLCRLSAKELSSHHNFAIVLGQYGTEDILRSTLKERHGISVEFHTQLEDIEFLKNDTEFVCTLRKRPPEEPAEGGRSEAETQTEKYRCDYLLGCDGAHSDVRHIAGIETVGEDIALVWTLMDVEATFNNFTPRPELGAHAFLGPHGIVGFAPLQNGAWRLLVDWKKCDAHLIPEELTVEWFQSMIDYRLPHVSITLGKPLWITRLEVRQRMASRFQRGRCFLLGDAAHNHSPSSGQGMNYGLQDAYNLAWKLARVLLHNAPESLLRTYHEERAPAAASVLRLTASATRLMGIQNAILVSIRNLILSILFNWAPFHKRSVDQLGQLSVSYHRRSSMCIDESGWRFRPIDSFLYWSGLPATPRPGDRCPTYPKLTYGDGGAAVPLLVLLQGTSFVALLFEPSDATVSACCAALAPLGATKLYVVHSSKVLLGSAADSTVDGVHVRHFVDNDRATELFSLGRDTCYLVRPDGHVCYRSQPATGDRLGSYTRKHILGVDPC